MDQKEKAIKLHREWNGKLETTSKAPVKDREALAIAYTPGVEEACKIIDEHHEEVYIYTFNAKKSKINAHAVIIPPFKISVLRNSYLNTSIFFVSLLYQHQPKNYNSEYTTY